MSRQFFDLHSEPFEPIEPGDAAGGDLAGTYPDPMVVALRNVALSTSAASAEYVLTATGPSDAQWLPPAASLESFATIAAMSAFDDARLSDGSLVYVKTVRSYFQKRTVNPVPAADGITIVALSTGDGAWYRVSEASLSWASQATWYIDPTNGNDQNDGSTSAAGGAGAGYVGALKTWAEFTRRVNTVFIDTTVNVAGNLTESIVGFFLKGSAAAILRIMGSPTVLASGGGSPGTSTFVDPVPATNSRGSVNVTNLIDSNGAATTIGAYVGKLLRSPAVSSSGPFLWPIARNNAGAGEGGYWARPSSSNTIPTNGAAVEVLDWVTVPTAQILTNGLPVLLYYFAFTVSSANPSDSPFVSHGCVLSSSGSTLYGPFIGCKFAQTINAVSPTYCIACFWTGATRSIVPSGSTMYLVGGGANVSMSILVGSGSVAFQGFHIEGGKLTVGSTNLSGGVVVQVGSATYSLGIFASATDALELIGTARMSAATVYGISTVVGGYGVRIGSGARLHFTGTPYVTGGSGDLLINGVNTAISPLTAGAATPVASDLSGTGGVGWGKWAAAPFSRNVVSYTNQTAITGS